QEYDAVYKAGAKAIFGPGTVIADAAADLVEKLSQELGFKLNEAAKYAVFALVIPVAAPTRRKARRRISPAPLTVRLKSEMMPVIGSVIAGRMIGVRDVIGIAGEGVAPAAASIGPVWERAHETVDHHWRRYDEGRLQRHLRQRRR